MSKKSKSMQPTCPKCGKYPFKIVQHECSATESIGTHETLEDIRARAVVAREMAIRRGDTYWADAFDGITNMIDELSPPSNNTAGDTKSSSAGVP